MPGTVTEPEDMPVSSMDAFIDFDVAMLDSQWSANPADVDFEALFPSDPHLGGFLEQGTSPNPSQQPFALGTAGDGMMPMTAGSRVSPPTSQLLLEAPVGTSGRVTTPPTKSSSDLWSPAGHQRQQFRTNRPHARTSIEHRYRSSINSHFRELRNSIEGGQKLNKSAVLSQASKQITHLSSAVAQQRQRIELLNRLIKSSQTLLEGLDLSSGGEPERTSDTRRIQVESTSWIP